MNDPLEEKVTGLLVGILADGFNRSILALEEAGAIDTTVMRSEERK